MKYSSALRVLGANKTKINHVENMHLAYPDYVPPLLLDEQTGQYIVSQCNQPKFRTIFLNLKEN